MALATPSVPAFMEGLHGQQRLMNNDFAKISQGHERPETRESKTRTEQIQRLLADYNANKDGMKLVHAVAHLYLF